MPGKALRFCSAEKDFKNVTIHGMFAAKENEVYEEMPAF